MRPQQSGITGDLERTLRPYPSDLKIHENKWMTFGDVKTPERKTRVVACIKRQSGTPKEMRMKVHLSTSENEHDWKPLGDQSGNHDTIENALESLKAATTTGNVKTGRRYLIEISDGATPQTETETQVDERRQLAQVMQAQTALQAAIDQLPEAIRAKVRNRYLDEVIQEQIEVVTDEYNRLNRGPDSLYTMLYRPCTQLGTLPPKVITEWTRVPAELAHVFPDKPVSKRLFGEFTTDRPLTDKELKTFEIRQIA